MGGIAFYTDSAFDAHLPISPTPSGDIPVSGMAIIGKSSVSGLSGVYSVAYTPASTNKEGAFWDVKSGKSYATISSDGELYITEGATNNEVIIRATSIFDSEIFAEKTIIVTYYAGAVTNEIKDYCERVISDGGILLKGSEVETQSEFIRHKLLLGVAPKIDFLGYKLDTSNEVVKLYSLDKRFDCTSLTNISVQDGVIATSSAHGLINWTQNFVLTGLAEMTHLYYEGPTTQINSAESVFIANLLKTSYGAPNLKRSAIFFQGNKLNFQYAALGVTSVNGFACNSFSKFCVSVNGDADGENFQYVNTLMIDGGSDISLQKVNGADFWGRALDAVSFIKLYNGFKLCIAG